MGVERGVPAERSEQCASDAWRVAEEENLCTRKEGEGVGVCTVARRRGWVQGVTQGYVERRLRVGDEGCL